MFVDVLSLVDSFEEMKKSIVGTLVTITPNLVDQIWEDRPELPKGKIISLNVKFSGESHIDKIAKMRKALAEEKCTHLVVTALDEVACWFQFSKL
jgi:Xaa-Pro aminopeptidase